MLLWGPTRKPKWRLGVAYCPIIADVLCDVETITALYCGAGYAPT